MSEIPTERICYPVSYANEDLFRGFSSFKKGDMEDELLVKQSLVKDLPEFERVHLPQTYITDGAAHILRNRFRENFIQLLGMPKIGKSTLLKKIALLAAQDMKTDPSAPAPLLVSLSSLPKDISSKMELIEACFAQFEEFEAYLRQNFFQGRILLLLDELDSAPGLNEKLADWLLALKTYIKLPLLVLSSRYSGFQELEGSTVLYIDLYPLKLQIAMAQIMLSEFQFERFVEVITGPSSNFCEFASTPFLFSLLLELFRWGAVGTDGSESRGKLFHLACKHLMADGSKYGQALEVIANDLLMRNVKQFGLNDLKTLGFEHIWNEIKSNQLLMLSECRSFDNSENEESVSEQEADNDHPHLLPRRDTTPQWVSNSKEAYFNFQIARKCLVSCSRTGDLYRFVHLRVTEVLSAQFYLNAVEDSLVHASAGFLMESSAYQRTFNACFPINFFYCKRFREVLLLFSTLCSESIFENLVKYLLARETYECCLLSEKLLKERGLNPSYRPLINKVKQDKSDMAKKFFSRGFSHPSQAVQKITRQEALDSGLAESDILEIMNKNIDSALKSSHWVSLKQLNLNKDSDLKVIKSVFSKLIEISSEILSNVTRPAPFKAILHKVYMTLLISRFEKTETPQTSSNYTPPVSSCSTPNKSENPNNTEESTFKISFDKFKFHKNDSNLLDKLSNIPKLTALVIDLLQICPVIDVTLCVKVLLILNCSVAQIHISLAARFACLEDSFERKEVLKVLRLLGFVTQHTVDLPLISLTLDQDLFFLAKEIIKLLNSEKLKKHAINVLVKEDSPQIKILLALRALAFVNKQDQDSEVYYFLVQFIDHYSLELRLEAIKSLYTLLKDTKLADKAETRKTLAVVPHVLKDRIKLPKYEPKLKALSVKCLIALWACLDKGKEDSYATQMFHILVKEQMGSSFLVGSFTSILAVVKDCFMKSHEEKTATWACLRSMSPVFEYLEQPDRAFLVAEIEKGLGGGDPKEIKAILKFLIGNSFFHEEKLDFLRIVLGFGFENYEFLVRYLAAALVRWREISFLKTLVPAHPVVGLELARLLFKLRQLIESLFDQADMQGNESIVEVKQVHNYYKSLVNQIAENLQWPSKVFPHRNQLLDISADPSFFKDEVAPEISASFADLDVSFPKYSVESIHADLEELPPPIQILQQLLLAGVRSEGLRHWVLWYLKRSDSIADLVAAGESWKLISSNKEFYNPHVEALLSKLLVSSPKEVLKVVTEINFKSDSFCVKIISGMIQGEIKCDNAPRAASICLEMNSPLALEEAFKLVNVCLNDSVHMFYLHSAGVKILESVQIWNDGQMHSVLKAMVSTGASLLVQPVWNYWMKMLAQRPSYLLSVHAVNVLENCNSWDCKFLLTRARIIGVLPVEQMIKETGSSMSTKKL